MDRPNTTVFSNQSIMFSSLFSNQTFPWEWKPIGTLSQYSFHLHTKYQLNFEGTGSVGTKYHIPDHVTWDATDVKAGTEVEFKCVSSSWKGQDGWKIEATILIRSDKWLESYLKIGAQLESCRCALSTAAFRVIASIKLNKHLSSHRHYRHLRPEDELQLQRQTCSDDGKLSPTATAIRWYAVISGRSGVGLRSRTSVMRRN